jgi:ABC-type antimicrobial peptide transport system permease subunit
LLRAVGFAPAAVRGQLLREGAALALAGAAIGVAGAIAWAATIVFGLRTWWFDAVGTDRLDVHAPVSTLLVGGAITAAASVGTLWRSIASVVSMPPRSLLGASEMPAGEATAAGTSPRGGRRARIASLVAASASVLVLALGFAGALGAVVAFFGAGGLALVSGLAFVAWRFRRPAIEPVAGSGWWTVARLGTRSVRQRPGRATTAVALIACATFIIVAVGAFRRGAPEGSGDRASGTGGYALIGQSVQPLMHDPGTEAGRDALSLPADESLLERATFTRLRLRPGDEASCLTLYRPTRPRIAGVPRTLDGSGRFRFAGTIATSDEERGRPWRLLQRRFEDGSVPAIGDANSLTYVLHLGLNDTMTVEAGDGRPVTLRIVGMLDDSALQSELLIDEAQFVRLFPREEGYRMLLVDVPETDAAALMTLLEDRLSDYGLDLQSTTERIASYHRVENTYISTFQALGGLGLLLGTLGVGAMLLRGVLERRRELSVLRAVGYRPAHLSLMVVAESAFVAGVGALVGTACALLAIGPALATRGAGRSAAGALWLPALVVAVALVSSLVAAVAVTRMPVASTIRNE